MMDVRVGVGVLVGKHDVMIHVWCMECIMVNVELMVMHCKQVGTSSTMAMQVL